MSRKGIYLMFSSIRASSYYDNVVEDGVKS